MRHGDHSMNSRPPKRKIFLLWAACLVFATGGVAFAALLMNGNALRSAAVRHFGGPFSLVNQMGETVTQAAFKGKPTAIFFGYTNCQDICKTTLTDMSRWQSKLGQPTGIQFVFVTVDPARDTPEVLRKYLQNFPGHFIALSGSLERVQAMLREYHVADQHVAEADGKYSIDHTASIFLINSDGSLAGTIGPQDTPASGLAKLRRLLSRKSI